MRIEIQRHYDDSEPVTLGTVETLESKTVHEVETLLKDEWDKFEEEREDEEDTDFIGFFMSRNPEYKRVATAYIVAVGV